MLAFTIFALFMARHSKPRKLPATRTGTAQ